MASLFKVDDELRDEARQLEALTQTLLDVWLFDWLVPLEPLEVVLLEQTELEGENGGLFAVDVAACIAIGSLGLLSKFGDDIGLVNGALVGVKGDCVALDSAVPVCFWFCC